ncbi:MAG: uroporphyrinogen decarboxylase family protein [Kiritimatiellae bacterium]|nr:uroporphyrinogen decarboxylase family protein [Kiritimatiellia bacterium]
MTSRERILKALNHQETDRPPRDLGGTESSGVTACAMRKLQVHLGCQDALEIFEPYQYVAYVNEGLRSRFAIDTLNLTPGPADWVERRHPEGFDVLLPRLWHETDAEDGATVVLGAGGQIVGRRPAGGLYFDPVNPPLRDVETPAGLDPFKKTIHGFDMPSFADETDAALRKRAQAMHATGDCVVFNLCCHILAAGQLLRGYENFMVDLLTDEPMARTLLDALLEGYCERIDRLAPLLRDCVDVVLLNDDLGTQNGPMLAPDTYRDRIKPYQKALFAHVKKRFSAPILFHSCGAVREFIPDLIEIGVDALNPVQISAVGMEPAKLKRDFGSDITFWGGGVDTQTVLNKKTPAEVADAVRRNVEIMAPGGGFVFCQVHNIQPDVPAENVVAMFDALDNVS